MISLGKGVNPIIIPPAMDKIVEQTRFFSLGKATRRRKTEFKPVKLRLKNWPCVISCPSGEVSEYDNIWQLVYMIQQLYPLERYESNYSPTSYG